MYNVADFKKDIDCCLGSIIKKLADISLGVEKLNTGKEIRDYLESQFGFLEEIEESEAGQRCEKFLDQFTSEL